MGLRFTKISEDRKMRFRIWKSRTDGIWFVVPIGRDYWGGQQYFPDWKSAVDWTMKFIDQ
jgi:hypothetical protein